MRNIVILVVLFVVSAMQLLAQDKTQITSSVTIKHGEVNNGVVIVTGQWAKGNSKQTAVELQCNKEVFSCKIPEPGRYQIVHLPKNHGLYDCQNVDLYESSANPETGDMIGEYCLMQTQRESAQR